MPRRTPVSYSPDLARRICEGVAAGATVKALARQPGMPCAASVFNWAREDPQFRALYREACERRAAATGRPGVTGRRHGLTPAMSDTIIGLLESGLSVQQVARRKGMPSFRSIHRWIEQDPDFRMDYEMACHFRAEMLADRVVEVADSEDIPYEQARLMVAVLKWRFGIMSLKRWGTPFREANWPKRTRRTAPGKTAGGVAG